MIARRKTRPGQEERGFVLLGVILVLAIIVAAVTMTLGSSTDTLREQTGLRNAEVAQAALSHGLALALDRLQQTDPSTLAAENHDIFNDRANATDFVGPIEFPDSAHPWFRQVQPVRIRVGLALAQRTQAPVGEDVRNTYGYVAEVQVSAEATGFGNVGEERVAVGVQIPHDHSHAK